MIYTALAAATLVCRDTAAYGASSLTLERGKDAVIVALEGSKPAQALLAWKDPAAAPDAALTLTFAPADCSFEAAAGTFRCAGDHLAARSTALARAVVALAGAKHGFALTVELTPKDAGKKAQAWQAAYGAGGCVR